LSPLAFVNFLQNHDQIGNRPFGDRLVVQAREAEIAAALAVTLLAPMPPLLFMGEEWGARQPFPFFCDFQGALAEAVRKGRRAEFASAYGAAAKEPPDPLAEQTLRAAKLDWNARTTPAAGRRLTLVRELLATRRREIAPQLPGVRFGTARRYGDMLSAHWRLPEDKTLTLIANLSPAAAALPRDIPAGRPIWGGQPSDPLPPWSVFWSIG
jgi:maltooligosyltrehalose trehalohydrolase